jgi:hypothetical protein
MCRNIRTLFNFEPPVADEEIRSASLQFVSREPDLDKACAAEFKRAGNDRSMAR